MNNNCTWTKGYITIIIYQFNKSNNCYLGIHIKIHNKISLLLSELYHSCSPYIIEKRLFHVCIIIITWCKKIKSSIECVIK